VKKVNANILIDTISACGTKNRD